MDYQETFQCGSCGAYYYTPTEAAECERANEAEEE